jgi:predicted DNA-binding protein YlxM (UPF0122 family)
MPFGEANGASILSDEQVIAMRQAYLTGDWSFNELAARFHVTKSTVSTVIACMNWRWLLEPGEADMLAQVRTERSTRKPTRKGSNVATSR